MRINANGFIKSTLAENLQKFVDKLKAVFGDDFVIKKEGVVDNVATASSLSVMDLEDQIAYLIKMLDPRTTEGEWQDKLYSYIGLVRRQATYTIVTRTVSGTAGTVIEDGALTFENKATKDQFVNINKMVIGSTGTAVVTFQAIESGAIELDREATLNIVTPIEGVTGVYYTEDNITNTGLDYEDDSEFRERWLLTSSSGAANTEDGLYKALLDLVETKSDLNIIQNRKSETVDGIEPHHIKIVINSPYDDKTIAQAISDHIVDGNQAGTVGSTAVTLLDSMGSEIEIRFQRAQITGIYLNVRVEIDDRSVMAQAQSDIKSNILDYIEKNKFDMGSKIWANMFASVIYDTKSVSAITELKISTDGTSWADYVQLGSEQVPAFESERIIVYEEQ